MKKVSTEHVLTSSIMFLVSLIVLLPLIMMVVSSLKTLGEITSPSFTWLPERLQFGNYAQALTRGNWPRYFFNSFYVTSVSVIVSLFLNSMAGYAFARLRFPGSRILFLTSLMAMMVPAQVTMVPVFIIMRSIPFAGGNNLFGQGGTGWIDTYMGLLGPILAHSFGVFLCRQYFLSFPSSLDDAATIDGCSRFRIYYQIYLPLSTPILATLGALKTSFTWNDYIWPLIIVNSDRMRTVQLALAYFRTQYGTDWHLMMAATTMIVVPLVLVFLFAQKYFIGSIVTTGIK